MKKFKSAALALALAASLIGCSAAPSETPETEKAAETQETPVRVGSLKGPTSIGLVHMMEEDKDEGSYEFTMARPPTSCWLP